MNTPQDLIETAKTHETSGRWAEAQKAWKQAQRVSRKAAAEDIAAEQTFVTLTAELEVEASGGVSHGISGWIFWGVQK